MTAKNIRLIGGEIWSEILVRQRSPGNALHQIELGQVDEVMDVVVGVLARYIGSRLADDEELPVTPLPRSS